MDNLVDKHFETTNTRIKPNTITMADSESFSASNLSSLDIIRFYLDRPKDLMKMFHQIGTKQMSSKEHKNGMIFDFYRFSNIGAKWISEIIKNYVTLLLYAAKTIDEMEKLDSIKHYFALKIETFSEQK